MKATNKGGFHITLKPTIAFHDKTWEKKKWLIIDTWQTFILSRSYIRVHIAFRQLKKLPAFSFYSVWWWLTCSVCLFVCQQVACDVVTVILSTGVSPRAMSVSVQSRLDQSLCFVGACCNYTIIKKNTKKKTKKQNDKQTNKV